MKELNLVDKLNALEWLHTTLWHTMNQNIKQPGNNLYNALYPLKQELMIQLRNDTLERNRKHN